MNKRTPLEKGVEVEEVNMKNGGKGRRGGCEENEEEDE